MKEITLSNNMINNISSQISASEIKKFVDNNRIEYLRYLITLIKTVPIDINGGVIND